MKLLFSLLLALSLGGCVWYGPGGGWHNHGGYGGGGGWHGGGGYHQGGGWH